MAKQGNDITGVLKGIFVLVLLFFMYFVIKFAPLGIIPALIMLYFLRDSVTENADTVKIGVYVFAVLFFVTLKMKLFPELEFADKYYREIFSYSALAASPKVFWDFFKIAPIFVVFQCFLLFTLWSGSILFTIFKILGKLLLGVDARTALLGNRKKAPKAKFNKLSDLLNDTKKHCLPLGVDMWEDGKTPICIPHRILNRHTCLVGTTGSGKTVTLYNFIYNALLYQKPIVFVDGKGDLGNIAKFKKFCQRLNRKVTVITIDGQTGYNPFATGTPTELTDKIISMFDWSEEHYKLTSSRFIQLLISYMQLEGLEINLANIIKYSDTSVLNNYHITKNNNYKPVTEKEEPETDGGLPDFGKIPKLAEEESTPEKTTDRRAAEILEKINGIEKKSIQGIQARIATLAEGDMSEMFSAPNAFNLSEAIENGEAVLFSLDSLRYPQQARALGRLVINDIKTCVSSHQRAGASPVSLIFDEFNVFATHEVVDVINKSRSAGFEALLSFQSLSDIDKLDKGQELRRQIIENCNTLIVQKQNDSQGAEELSSLFGTFEDVEATVQAEEDMVTGMQSYRKVRKFAVHPDDIKQLGVGEAFIKVAEYGYTKISVYNAE